MSQAVYSWWILFFLGTGLAHAQERARLEIPYGSETVVIKANRIFSGGATTAEGNVVVQYEKMTLKTPLLEYDRDRQILIAEQGVEVTEGIQWLKGSRAEFNLANKTGFIEDAEGFTDDELFISAKKLLKTGPNTFKAEDGWITACNEAIPKWRFSAGSTKVGVNRTATIRNAVFRIKQVPVLYFPYIKISTKKKRRSTGFLVPSTGNSNTKGRRISQSFFLVLGRSADILIREDYFSKRGFGHAFTFRARPNNVTSLELDAYAVNDRQNQGGTSISGTGETVFGDNYRLVADFNLVSSFVFRRVFSDSFYDATRPSETSQVFLTRNKGPLSFNLRSARDETVFPERNVVTTQAPAFSLNLNGLRVGQTSAYFDLNAGIEGVSRADRTIKTSRLSQRMDFHPQIYFPISLAQGLKLTPHLGVRNTFYSDSMSHGGESSRSISRENLTRNYFEFSLSADGWGLSKINRRANGTSWKHLIEPLARYTYRTGIDNFSETILFDENDAITNTNEVEYGMVHRFFVRRNNRNGRTNHELLSIKVAQKHFFDSDFGGAFEQGSINQLSPFFSLTGFHYGSLLRNRSPLTAVARISPNRRFSVDVHSDYDFEFRKVRNLAVTGFYNKGLLGLATTYFLTRELEALTSVNNQLQGSIRWGNLRKGFSLSSIFSYDTHSRTLLNSRSQLNYFWDCCGVSVQYQRINLGLREEQQLRFSFSLKGIGAFGTLRPADSIF